MVPPMRLGEQSRRRPGSVSNEQRSRGAASAVVKVLKPPRPRDEDEDKPVPDEFWWT